MDKLIKVGVIDDNPSITEGLKVLFERNNIDCKIIKHSKIDFLSKLGETIVDLIIADVIMPDVNGLELFEQLNKEHPHTPVIVYSNIRNVQLINDLFRLECVYSLVSKTDSLDVLIERIFKVNTENERIFPNEVLNIGMKDVSLTLSERELEVLEYLSMGHSSKKIGQTLHISENTVMFYRKKLFAIFNTSNVYHLIVEAKECGFLK